MPKLHVVFLQGMQSAFFSKIARELSARGCKVTGINFCVGDALFWRGENTLAYRGSLAKWPVFFADFIERSQATDIVMTGDQRDYHKQAIEVAKAQGVRVSIVDFGYLRPGWLTLERDGKNSNSRFPKTPEALMTLASSLPAPDLASPYTDSFWTMARGDLKYSFSNLFLGWLYPRYRNSDRRPHPIIYFPAMGRRLLFMKKNHIKARAKTRALMASGARYFLFPLQLEHDYQLIAYSPFSRQQDAIKKVIQSFARHAANDSRLLIKVHPWDPGLTHWKKYAERLARECGVEARVDYYDGGDLDDMIRGSHGMITINSTAGIQALQFSKPVMVLGVAIYHMPGLTYQQELDSFWSQAKLPESAMVEAFLKVLIATIQVKGAFFDEPGLSAAAYAAAERLFHGTVGMSAIETDLFN